MASADSLVRGVCRARTRPFSSLNGNPSLSLSGKNIKSIFATQMRSEYFPVPIDDMGARIEFLRTKEDIFRAGKATANVVKHRHPGDAYSYRLEGEEGKVEVTASS